MKNFLFFSFFLLFSLNQSFAQKTSFDRIKPIQGASGIVALEGTQTKAHVTAIDALLVINHLSNGAIEEIEVITGSYDAKYRAEVRRLRPAHGMIAQFQILHPSGPYLIILKPVKEDPRRVGRQQNRRVEISLKK